MFFFSLANGGRPSYSLFINIFYILRADNLAEVDGMQLFPGSSQVALIKDLGYNIISKFIQIYSYTLESRKKSQL